MGKYQRQVGTWQCPVANRPREPHQDHTMVVSEGVPGPVKSAAARDGAACQQELTKWPLCARRPRGSFSDGRGRSVNYTTVVMDTFRALEWTLLLAWRMRVTLDDRRVRGRAGTLPPCILCSGHTRAPSLAAAPDLPSPRDSRWPLWSLSTGTMARAAEGLKQSRFTSKELDLDRQGFTLIRLYSQANRFCFKRCQFWSPWM